MNTVQKLCEVGQSIWYDNIQRAMLSDGTMAGMIAREEIRGVTSNPTIFLNAISGSDDYDDELAILTRDRHSPREIFWSLAVKDIQAAADLFLPLYQRTHGGDGYVSLEVSPDVAQDTEATLAEARRLWRRVDRPNLMVKIPATRAGIPAIRAAIAEGININVTLIFARQRYAEVMDAYLSGLEGRVAAGQPINTIASVASFFVSRVDSLVDKRLQELVDAGKSEAAALMGQAAIANARLAYADFKEAFNAPRFRKLRPAGARVQRPLWASTGTKNPAYSDVLYVEELIGPETVNTVPPHTLAAFLDHGRVRPTVEEDLDGARRTLEALEDLGISMTAVTDQLEEEGVAAFAKSFNDMIAGVEAWEAKEE